MFGVFDLRFYTLDFFFDVFYQLLLVPKCLQRLGASSIDFKFVNYVFKIIIGASLIVFIALLDQFVHLVYFLLDLAQLGLHLHVLLIQVVVLLLHRIVVDIQLFLAVTTNYLQIVYILYPILFCLR